MIKTRFNGLLPIVIDIETGGVDCRKSAILEIAAIGINQNQQGFFCEKKIWHEHIKPFEGSLCCPESLEFNNIIPDHPLRFAISEKEALLSLANQIKLWLENTTCKRAVLVGHNAHFDLNFIMQAIERQNIAHFPLHSFTCIDTATLGGFLYKKTVLAQIMRKAKIKFNTNEAHGALYDAKKTAELFCAMLNNFKDQQYKEA